MKENWERTKPLQQFNEQEIIKMMQNYLPDKKVTSVKPLNGGYRNSNYKIHIESMEKPLVLRVSNEKNCMFENSLHQLLSKKLPVPEIYYSEYFGDKSFSIMEWKEGIQLKKVMYGYDEKAIIKAAFSTGYWLSEMRKVTFSTSGFFDEKLEVSEPLTLTPEIFLKFMEQFLLEGQTSHWLGKELSGKLWVFVHKNSHFLEEIDHEPALVHSDLNGLNILVSDKDSPGVTGILDWEFAFAGPVYVDIGNMLRYENIPYYKVFEHAFMEGVQSGGMILAPEWKKIAKLVDLIALCELLDNRFGGKNRVNDIKSLIEQTLRKWDSY